MKTQCLDKTEVPTSITAFVSRTFRFAASRDWKGRCLKAFGTLFLAVVLLDANWLNGQTPRSVIPRTFSPLDSTLQVSEWKIMDRLALAYGSTDWSAVSEFLVSNPGYSGNPNIVFIPLSLGNVYLNRYEWGGDLADFERSLAWLEWVAGNRWLWGQRWLTAPVVSYLDITLLRLRGECVPAGYAARLDSVWASALAITAEEADARLTSDFPYLPYDSSATGDSKAEENAWEASLLSAAANLLPDHPNGAAWDQKARQLAYNAITRPSDAPGADGLKTTTVEEDFTLSNHGFFPNPTYSAATIELLLQGALTYRLSGREIPPEFGHNLEGFYEVYKTYVDDELQWIVPSDPSGEASLFPFAFDPDLEDREVRCESDNGYLWLPTEPVAAMEVGAPLWTAVLNSKVVMFYLMGSYLWHFPPGVSRGNRCIGE
jgi:hypothetical protein